MKKILIIVLVLSFYSNANADDKREKDLLIQKLTIVTMRSMDDALQKNGEMFSTLRKKGHIINHSKMEAGCYSPSLAALIKESINRKFDNISKTFHSNEVISALQHTYSETFSIDELEILNYDPHSGRKLSERENKQLDYILAKAAKLYFDSVVNSDFINDIYDVNNLEKIARETLNQEDYGVAIQSIKDAADTESIDCMRQVEEKIDFKALE